MESLESGVRVAVSSEATGSDVLQGYGVWPSLAAPATLGRRLVLVSDLDLLPPALRAVNRLDREIALPYPSVIEAVDVLASQGVLLVGWEGNVLSSSPGPGWGASVHPGCPPPSLEDARRLSVTPAPEAPTRDEVWAAGFLTRPGRLDRCRCWRRLGLGEDLGLAGDWCQAGLAFGQAVRLLAGDLLADDGDRRGDDRAGGGLGARLACWGGHAAFAALVDGLELAAQRLNGHHHFVAGVKGRLAEQIAEPGDRTHHQHRYRDRSRPIHAVIEQVHSSPAAGGAAIALPRCL
jgi:hypothetical protein